MNHVLKIIDNGDKYANLAAYNDPSLPISNILVEEIVKYVKK